MARSPLKSEISCTVGPMLAEPREVATCTPSVFHGTSDAGLPLRSGCVGWLTPGSVPVLTTEYGSRAERRVEQEALITLITTTTVNTTPGRH